VDLDLRKLRYFVAVAEHLHYARAAEELHIAQPVLSRQIHALEHELSVTLFERDRRGTKLTPAGTQLLTDARPLLASAEAAGRRAVRASRSKDTFTVGFMPGLVVATAIRTISARHPELSIQVMRTGWDDQAEVIRDGRVDVGYVRLPVDQRGLRVEPLLTEPRVAMLPAGHRLAGKEFVHLVDLADEHLLQQFDVVPEWRDVARELRDGRYRETPLMRTVEEKLEHVAAGNGIVVLPLSTAVSYPRQDVVHVAIDDIAHSQVGVAWDSGRRTPLIPEFVAIALDCAAEATAR
jgi:DNA-binding transcriptional LysR family regulator